MLENKNVVYGSFLPMITTAYAEKGEKNNFKTFEQIAKFSDNMELIEEYKNMQEGLLRNIVIPKDYLDAWTFLGLKE